MAGLLHVMDIGRCAYDPALALQERLVAERVAGRVPDTLVLVEHEPVYTLGRRAVEANVLASPEARSRAGIAIVRTGRGGDVTYHGPGQLVGYPIVHLPARGGGVVAHVERIERTIIRLLAEFGIEAGTDSVNRGVWVGRDKIAAIGVRVTRQVTMHGFALNISPDMTHYAGIVPCGLPERGVTSMRLQGSKADFAQVKPRLVDAFADVYGYDSVVPVREACGGKEEGTA